jgi:hypothetical protein
LIYVAAATQRQNATNVIVFVEGWWEISNEKDNRGGDTLSGAEFGSDGPRTRRRRRAGGIIWRPRARTSWCRGWSHCRLYRGTIDCERLGFKTIKLSPAAGGARSKCKLQIAVCTAKRSLCSNASSGGAAVCSNKRIRSTTRATARVRRGCASSRQPVCSKLYNKSAAREQKSAASVPRSNLWKRSGRQCAAAIAKGSL